MDKQIEWIDAKTVKVTEPNVTINDVDALVAEKADYEERIVHLQARFDTQLADLQTKIKKIDDNLNEWMPLKPEVVIDVEAEIKP